MWHLRRSFVDTKMTPRKKSNRNEKIPLSYFLNNDLLNNI